MLHIKHSAYFTSQLDDKPLTGGARLSLAGTTHPLPHHQPPAAASHPTLPPEADDYVLQGLVGLLSRRQRASKPDRLHSDDGSDSHDGGCDSDKPLLAPPPGLHQAPGSSSPTVHTAAPKLMGDDGISGTEVLELQLGVTLETGSDPGSNPTRDDCSRSDDTQFDPLPVATPMDAPLPANLRLRVQCSGSLTSEPASQDSIHTAAIASCQTTPTATAGAAPALEAVGVFGDTSPMATPFQEQPAVVHDAGGDGGTASAASGCAPPQRRKRCGWLPWAAVAAAGLAVGLCVRSRRR